MSKFEDNPFSDPAIDNPFAVRSPSLLEEMYCYFAFPANICVFFRILLFSRLLGVRIMLHKVWTTTIPLTASKMQIKLR